MPRAVALRLRRCTHQRATSTHRHHRFLSHMAIHGTFPVSILRAGHYAAKLVPADFSPQLGRSIQASQLSHAGTRLNNEKTIAAVALSTRAVYYCGRLISNHH